MIEAPAAGVWPRRPETELTNRAWGKRWNRDLHIVREWENVAFSLLFPMCGPPTSSKVAREVAYNPIRYVCERKSLLGQVCLADLLLVSMGLTPKCASLICFQCLWNPLFDKPFLWRFFLSQFESVSDFWNGFTLDAFIVKSLQDVSREAVNERKE